VQGQRATIAYELLQDDVLIVIYKAAGVPRDGEWDLCLDFLSSTLHYGNRLRFFTYNEDGEMPREHQTRLTEMMRGYTHKVAVVSPSLAMRFMVSIFMMWNRNVRFFSPAQVGEAYQHLGCEPSTQLAIEAALDRARGKIRDQT
jgi:hypothetical protein